MSEIVLTQEQAQEILDALASTPIGRAIGILMSASQAGASAEEPEESPE